MTSCGTYCEVYLLCHNGLRTMAALLLLHCLLAALTYSSGRRKGLGVTFWPKQIPVRFGAGLLPRARNYCTQPISLELHSECILQDYSLYVDVQQSKGVALQFCHLKNGLKSRFLSEVKSSLQVSRLGNVKCYTLYLNIYR